VVVDEFVAKLKLTNVKTRWGRAEELKELHNSFDIIISRAVAYLPDLIKLSTPFVKGNGYLVFWKLNNKDEIERGNKIALQLGLNLIERYNYKIKGSDRIILVYLK